MIAVEEREKNIIQNWVLSLSLSLSERQGVSVNEESSPNLQ